MTPQTFPFGLDSGDLDLPHMAYDESGQNKGPVRYGLTFVFLCRK